MTDPPADKAAGRSIPELIAKAKQLESRSSVLSNLGAQMMRETAAILAESVAARQKAAAIRRKIRA